MQTGLYLKTPKALLSVWVLTFHCRKLISLSHFLLHQKLTKAVEVVILDPPAAPATIFGLPFLSMITAGHMEDRGRFPGLMKLAGDGGMPNELVMFGEEKSSISSLKTSPVLWPMTPEPNLCNIYLLMPGFEGTTLS